MPAWFRHKTAAIGFVLLAALFVTALYIAYGLPGMQSLELSITDARARRYVERFRARTPVVIVDIDDDSYGVLRAVWPWPRSYYARLIDNLKKAGARLVVMDIVFDKPREDDPKGDSAFTEAVAMAGNIVLAGKTLTGNTYGVLEPYSMFLGGRPSQWGSVDIQDDVDGIARSYYYGRPDRYGHALPTLAVRAWSLLNRDTLLLPGDGLFGIAFPGGAKSFMTIPFYEVVDDSTLETRDEVDYGEAVNYYDTLLAQGVLKDKIVFVGASLTELHDVRLTPFSVSTENTSAILIPGVEVHAAAFHTLYQGYRIREVGRLLSILIPFLICAGLLMLGARSRAVVTFVSVALAAVLYTGATYLIYSRFQLILPVVPVLFSLMLCFAGQQGYLFYLEQRRRRQVTQMFGQYVPKQVVAELIKHPEKMKLGGERRELSVLFSDIAGFTTLSEVLEPEKLILLLNEYLSAMTDIVHEHNGIIDKYEGDAIMAEFGIPLLTPDHAVNACETAFAMQKKLHELGDKWKAEGRPVLTARVGIGTGHMVFGNMGSNQVFDYTVIGDVVNLSSRLEGVNKEYGTKIIINERAYELAKHRVLARELDFIRVKGKKVPVKAYHLMSTRDSAKAPVIENVIRLFEEALAVYRKQDWDLAIILFKQVLEIWPDDKPSEVYISRCERFKSRQPGRDWDGVFTLQNK